MMYKKELREGLYAQEVLACKFDGEGNVKIAITSDRKPIS